MDIAWWGIFLKNGLNKLFWGGLKIRTFKKACIFPEDILWWNQDISWWRKKCKFFMNKSQTL